ADLGADAFSCSLGSRTSRRAVDEPVKVTKAWQARLPLAVGTIWMSSRFSWPGSSVPSCHMSRSPSICAFGSVPCTLTPAGTRVWMMTLCRRLVLRLLMMSMQVTGWPSLAVEGQTHSRPTPGSWRPVGVRAGGDRVISLGLTLWGRAYSNRVGRDQDE